MRKLMKIMKKKAAPKARPASKKAVRKGAPKLSMPAAKKARRSPQLQLKVASATLSGGYHVFGSPVRPKHVTRQAIIEAVAAVD
jgi:hypothetical protein